MGPCTDTVEERQEGERRPSGPGKVVVRCGHWLNAPENVVPLITADFPGWPREEERLRRHHYHTRWGRHVPAWATANYLLSSPHFIWHVIELNLSKETCCNYPDSFKRSFWSTTRFLTFHLRGQLRLFFFWLAEKKKGVGCLMIVRHFLPQSKYITSFKVNGNCWVTNQPASPTRPTNLYKINFMV